MPANVSEKTRPTVTAGLAKRRRRGEPVRRADVRADGGRGEHAATGAGQREDQDDEPGGGDDLAEPQVPAGPVLGGQLAERHLVHQVRELRAGDRAEDLRHGVGRDVAARQAGAGAATEQPVGGGHDRVEVGTGDRAEHQDEDGQPEERGGRVLQAAGGRRRRGEPLRGDPGPDDDGHEQRGAEELRGQSSGEAVR